jgi:hypothetical protein
MTPEDQELTNWLCKEIQEEQDPEAIQRVGVATGCAAGHEG